MSLTSRMKYEAEEKPPVMSMQYGSPTINNHRGLTPICPSPLIVIDDIEEEEGERKKMIDELSECQTSFISSYPKEERSLDIPMRQEIAPVDQPIAGMQSSVQPRPPPLRAIAHVKPITYPPGGQMVKCHRCTAPMRICVRKLRYQDHVKQYPSYRCTRKGCQTFKSMRLAHIAVGHTMIRLQQAPLPVPIAPLRNPFGYTPSPETAPPPPSQPTSLPDPTPTLPVENIYQMASMRASASATAPAPAPAAAPVAAPAPAPAAPPVRTQLFSQQPPCAQQHREVKRRPTRDRCTQEQKAAVQAILQQHLKQEQQCEAAAPAPSKPEQALPPTSSNAFPSLPMYQIPQCSLPVDQTVLFQAPSVPNIQESAVQSKAEVYQQPSAIPFGSLTSTEMEALHQLSSAARTLAAINTVARTAQHLSAVASQQLYDSLQQHDLSQIPSPSLFNWNSPFNFFDPNAFGALPVDCGQGTSGESEGAMTSDEIIDGVLDTFQMNNMEFDDQLAMELDQNMNNI